MDNSTPSTRGPEMPAGAPWPRQFSLRSLFAATAAVAVVLAAARWYEVSWREALLFVYVAAYLLGPLLVFFVCTCRRTVLVRVALSLGLAAAIVVPVVVLGSDRSDASDLLLGTFSCWVPQVCLTLVIIWMSRLKP